MKKIPLAVVILAPLFAVMTNAADMRYKADVYCNFKFDRTVEIVFNPENRQSEGEGFLRTSQSVFDALIPS